LRVALYDVDSKIPNLALMMLVKKQDAKIKAIGVKKLYTDIKEIP